MYIYVCVFSWIENFFRNNYCNCALYNMFVFVFMIKLDMIISQIQHILWCLNSWLRFHFGRVSCVKQACRQFLWHICWKNCEWGCTETKSMFEPAKRLRSATWSKQQRNSCPLKDDMLRPSYQSRCKINHSCRRIAVSLQLLASAAKLVSKRGRSHVCWWGLW